MSNRINAFVAHILSLSMILYLSVPARAELPPVPVPSTAAAPAIDPLAVTPDHSPDKEQTASTTTNFLLGENPLSAADVPCTTAMCGVTPGQTVSGTIFVQPNLTLNPSIRKIAYYLNGTQSGKYYSTPFTWGGTSGFDTRTFRDGIYTLSGAYTTNAGDIGFSISFAVNNTTQDSTPPVVSGVLFGSVTDSSATIVWTTDEASDSQVQYRIPGTTAWTNTSLNPSLLTGHNVALTGLSPNTIYEFQVKSRDAAGNLAIQSTPSTFTTTAVPPDFSGVTEGATVSGVVFIGPDLSTHSTIRKVFYYLNGTQAGRVYASPFLWGGLTGNGSNGFDTATIENGTYALSMIYADAAGEHSASISFIVNNSGIDTTPPVITTVSSNYVSSNGATITWNTDEAGDSQVRYRAQGTTTWTDTALDPSLGTSHSVVLTGLVPNTVYEYQVKSGDHAGNLAIQSTLSNFTTLAADTTPPLISTVISGKVTSAGATVTWTTNEASDSLLEYRGFGNTTWLKGASDTSLVTSHSLSLFGLNGSKTYEFRVISKDAAGNPAQSPVSTFTTLVRPTTAPIYMLGDSITEWTDWEADLERADVINGGVAGERTDQFLARLQNVYNSLPEIVFVMGGINDLRAGYSVDVTYQNYIQILEELAAHGIRPVITSTLHVREAEAAANQKVTELNTRLRAYAGTANYDYIDLDAQLSENGHIKPEYTYDGLHITRTAYQLWQAEVLKVLARYGIGDHTAPVISAVTSSNVTSSAATVLWTTDEAADSQLEYRVQGTEPWLSTAIDPALVTNHSVVLTGLTAGTVYEYRAKSRDVAGNLATQATVSTFATFSEACTTAMCGVTPGQTVSGTIFVQPNLTLDQGVRKVAYYLNGTQFGKYYTAPFTWGGTGGFNTTSLPNGAYTLDGDFTNATGDHAFSIPFTVSNP